MKKVISLALILVLAFATIAIANPYIVTGSGPAHQPTQQQPAPQTTERHSSSNDGAAIAIGLGAALLIGAIIANNNSKHSSSSSSVATIKEHAAATARQDAQAAADLAGERGVDAAIQHVINEWDNKGCRAYSESDGSETIVRVSGLHQDAKTAKITYIFRPEYKDVTVKVSVPDCGIVEEASAAYVESQRGGYRDDAFRRYLGITLSGEKDSTARPIIGEVERGSAAYYGGIRAGAVLVALDSHEIRSTGVERLESYLAQRARAGAVVRVTVHQNGRNKIADLQM